MGVVAAPRRLLHSRAAELLKAQVEAEGFTLGTPGASAGLPVEQAAALLTSSSRLVLDCRLAFSIPLLHHLKNMERAFCVVKGGLRTAVPVVVIVLFFFLSQDM